MRSVALSPADAGRRAGGPRGHVRRRRRARRPGRRRRRRRRRVRPRRRHPRPERRTRRGPRLRLRHLQPLEQAHPRRAALPGDARLPAGRRGAAGARAAHPEARPAPDQAGAVPLPAGAPRLGAALRRLGRRALRHARPAVGPGPRRAAPPPPHPPRRAADRPGAEEGRAGRARCSTTTRRSTTPGTRCSSPAPPPPTARTSRPGPGSSGCSRRASGSSAPRCTTWSPGGTFDVRARQVVNATGVWTDDTQGLAGERGQFQVRASKGIHLVVPRDRIRSDSGLILRTEKSVLFVIPWGRHWIIGTTDTDWSLDRPTPPPAPPTSSTCSTTSTRSIEPPLTHEDVEGVYAGLRPLLSGESESTSKLSREHAVAHTVPGLVVDRGREVHDVPRDGEGRGRRRGARAGDGQRGPQGPRSR